MKLTLEHVTEGALIVDELVRANVPLAIGPTFGQPSKIELQHKSFKTPGILANAGCKVSIITDSPVIPEQYLSLCAGLAVKEGMKPFDALQAITINPAKHIGIADRVGSLEVGKDADIVLSAGCPFESSNEIVDVYVNGVKVEKREFC